MPPTRQPPARQPLSKSAPEAYRAVGAVEAYIQGCGLEKSLIELVKLLASRINGCAFCIDMHTKSARRRGETEQRLSLLNAWPEASCYTAREQIALEWTEQLTRLSTQGAPSLVRDRLRRHFSEVEVVDLTVLIGLINLWNRIAVGGGFQLELDQDGGEVRSV